MMSTDDKERIDLFKSKLAMVCTVPLENDWDLSRAYTPGVAEPCKKIHAEGADLSFDYTCRGNFIAVVSNGTRVLGLGNIGPEAAMPVMEGKSVLFKAFADVDCIPLCLDLTSVDDIVKTVKALQPSFAGINLEDIQSPKCYEIERGLKEELSIPVFHDDQHGTAIICCASVLSALRLVKKNLADVKIVLVGAGAAGTAIANLLFELGAKNLTVCNSKGTIYENQPGLNDVQLGVAKKTGMKKQISFEEAAAGADVLLGVSAAGKFTDAVLQSLNADSIVFAMANPEPECSYARAKELGIRVVGTGRSDFPNQVNNVKAFPGVFRGALDVRARAINEQMKIAAVHALDQLVSDDELHEDHVTPDTFDPRVAPAVAAAVAKAAMETGVARIQVDPEEVRRRTEERVAKLKE